MNTFEISIMKNCHTIKTLFLLTVRPECNDHRSGWQYIGGHCYYISEGKQPFTNEFCETIGASLLLLEWNEIDETRKTDIKNFL